MTKRKVNEYIFKVENSLHLTVLLSLQKQIYSCSYYDLYACVQPLTFGPKIPNLAQICKLIIFVSSVKDV